LIDFAQERPKEALLIDTAKTHMAIEIAVGALLSAEWPVHVDAKILVFSRA